MQDESPSAAKRPRTSEDFYLFCQIVLEYENYYEVKKQEEMRTKTSSPLGSTGSREDSIKSEVSSAIDAKNSDVDTDDDSYDSVTCYCMKPFAGRPMIECSQCLTWVHLSCAKIKKTNIPEVYICVRCKNERQEPSRTEEEEESQSSANRVQKRTSLSSV